MDLSDIVEVKEVNTEEQINEYLSKGWKLLSIDTSYIPSGEDFYTIAYVGRPSNVPPFESKKKNTPLLDIIKELEEESEDE